MPLSAMTSIDAASASCCGVGGNVSWNGESGGALIGGERRRREGWRRGETPELVCGRAIGVAVGGVGPCMMFDRRGLEVDNLFCLYIVSEVSGRGEGTMTVNRGEGDSRVDDDEKDSEATRDGRVSVVVLRFRRRISAEVRLSGVFGDCERDRCGDGARDRGRGVEAGDDILDLSAKVEPRLT